MVIQDGHSRPRLPQRRVFRGRIRQWAFGSEATLWSKLLERVRWCTVQLVLLRGQKAPSTPSSSSAGVSYCVVVEGGRTKGRRRNPDQRHFSESTTSHTKSKAKAAPQHQDHDEATSLSILVALQSRPNHQKRPWRILIISVAEHR